LIKKQYYLIEADTADMKDFAKIISLYILYDKVKSAEHIDQQIRGSINNSLKL
jgi:hypothetical protein